MILRSRVLNGGYQPLACVTKHFHGPFNSFSIYDILHDNVLYREELSTHNKGKDGYVEKLEFLERADLRFGD